MASPRRQIAALSERGYSEFPDLGPDYVSSTTLDVAEGLAGPVTELVRAREEGAVGFENGPSERVGEMSQDAILIGASGAASLAPRCARIDEGTV
jgi:hypothetical protein